MWFQSTQSENGLFTNSFLTPCQFNLDEPHNPISIKLRIWKKIAEYFLHLNFCFFLQHKQCHWFMLLSIIGTLNSLFLPVCTLTLAHTQTQTYTLHPLPFSDYLFLWMIRESFKQCVVKAVSSSWRGRYRPHVRGWEPWSPSIVLTTSKGDFTFCAYK